MPTVTKYIAGPSPLDDKLIVAGCEFIETAKQFRYADPSCPSCRTFKMLAGGSRQVYNKDRKWEMTFLSDTQEEAIGRLLGQMRRAAEKARKQADRWERETKAIEEQVTANSWRQV